MRQSRLLFLHRLTLQSVHLPRPRPPVVAAVLLAFPFTVLSSVPVWIGWFFPWIVMLVSERANSPSPFILPFCLAVTTVPVTLHPLGIAVFPCTVTGCAKVARKVWPARLVLEPKAWSTVTVSAVPAGTMMG